MIFMDVDSQVDFKEKVRLQSLYQYDVLDTEREKEYDDLTELAASICDAPISRINLIDKKRQWSKSIFGDSQEDREISRDKTVCQHTIHKDEVYEIPDLRKDERFAQLSYVKGDPGLRFYAGAPLIDPNGNAIGALCILDYKERTLSDKQKKQLKILASDIMARFELRKKNKHLRELNDYKVKLMKMLSHDMRSPLNGIIGVSSLMNEMMGDVSEEEMKEMFDIIEQSAIQLNQMIDEIMSYSIIESSGFSLDASDSNLNDVLANMKKLYSPVARSKYIELIFKTKNIEEPVRIDEDKFEQIFGNLLSNALKFTPKGGIVTCFLEKIEDENNEFLKLIVKDTGLGMDDETLSKLFQRRDNNSAKSGTAGEKSTGIGLSIISYFVELHNGTITVDSTPGMGTEFKVMIPLKS